MYLATRRTAFLLSETSKLGNGKIKFLHGCLGFAVDLFQVSKFVLEFYLKFWMIFLNFISFFNKNSFLLKYIKFSIACFLKCLKITRYEMFFASSYVSESCVLFLYS